MAQPRILVLDIETSPHVGFFWGLYKQNIGIDQIIEPSRMICWAAKWAGERGVYSGAEWDKGGDWLNLLHSLIEEADAICHYNGESFDWPIIRREFKEAGLEPPPPPLQIDLLKTVKEFRLASNKLDWASLRWLEARKIKTSFDLWIGCYLGDPKSQIKMTRYNRKDVVLTDRLREDVLPYALNTPSIPLFAEAGLDSRACPRCGSENTHRRGYAYTKQSAFPRFQCQDCKGWYRGTVRDHGVRVRAI